MKVTLGNRKASNTKVGLTEMHYGHAFVVQEDKTLACDMDDAFAKDELEAGRVVRAATKAPRSEEVLLDPLVNEQAMARPDLRQPVPYDPDIVGEASVRADKQLEWEYQQEHIARTKAEITKETDKKRKLLQIETADETSNRMGKHRSTQADDDLTEKTAKAQHDGEKQRDMDKQREADQSSQRATANLKNIDAENAGHPAGSQTLTTKK